MLRASARAFFCVIFPTAANSLVVYATRDDRLFGRAIRRTRLTLGEDADQRAARRGLGAEIAHEAVLCPNLDVAGSATGVIHQNRAERRRKRIADRKLFESIVLDELVRRLFGERR